MKRLTSQDPLPERPGPALDAFVAEILGYRWLYHHNLPQNVAYLGEGYYALRPPEDELAAGDSWIAPPDEIPEGHPTSFPKFSDNWALLLVLFGWLAQRQLPVTSTLRAPPDPWIVTIATPSGGQVHFPSGTGDTLPLALCRAIAGYARIQTENAARHSRVEVSPDGG